MEFPPAADELGLECYLASLANPVRDLAAMKRAFEEEPQLSPADVSGGMTPSPEASPSLSALGATPPSDGFDFDLGPDFQNETAVATAVVAADDNIGEVGANVEADLPGGSAHPGSKTPKPNTAEPRGGALRTATARQPPPQLPAPPVRTSDAAATAKGLNPGGTCMIDLRNIWQRTGAVSRAISQTSVKQSSLVKDLRESLVRLDLQHRQKEEQEARRQIAEPVDGGKHRADGGDDKDGGRGNPIDVETSMSFSLKHPPEEPDSAAAATTAAGRGGGGAARRFALVVSLAHVHNISATTERRVVGGGVAGPAGTNGEGNLTSQLRVQLGSGGNEAIVTARRK
ncbi:unnamed protein product [Ectocarpus fasciculatus]